MSNSIGITNSIKKVGFETKDFTTAKQCNVIIPYKPSGYEDYSNYGFVGGQYEIDNFLTYKRIYTGNDAFIITWKNSTSLDEVDSFGQIRQSWKIGDYILGFNEGYTSEVSIDDDASFSDYKKFGVNNTIVFRIPPTYEFTENDKYLFYKVPEISKDILYRVVSLDVEYEGRMKVCYVLTLKSVQQELENTGRAKSQNVMPNAPGQCYFDAKIVSKKDLPEDWETNEFYKQIDDDRYLTYDEAHMYNNPCKSVVVKMFGLGILHNFTMVGRSASRSKPNLKYNVYGTPMLIFPINFKQATTPTLYRTQQPSNNFYFVWNLQPVIRYKKEAFGVIKDAFDIDKIWPSQGIFQYPASGGTPDFLKTNPLENGQFKYTLYGIVQTPTNLGGLTIYNPWAFSIGSSDLTFDCSGTYGAVVNYKIYGNTTRKIHDYLWDSYWIQKKVRTLPLSKENTLTFGDVLGTGVQGLLTGTALSVIAGSALFGIGLLGTLATKLQIPKISGILGIVSAELTDFMVNEASSSVINMLSDSNWFRMSYFLNSSSSEFLTFFNTETLNTSFEADLTTSFQTKEWYLNTRNKFRTLEIGQKYDSNGRPYVSGDLPLLVKGGEELQEENSEYDTGYIIDSFNLQATFKGDFSVEFLDKDRKVIWSGVYQSEAKWTNSLREINTWRNTSIYGRENIFLDKPAPWPAEVPYSTPWGVAENIDISVKDWNKILYNNGNDIESIGTLYSGKGWFFVDKDWNGDTYQGDKLPWITNSNEKVLPKSPKLQLSFSMLEKKVKILDSSVLIEPKAFFEKYGPIYLNFKVNGMPQRVLLFDKDMSYRDEGTYIGASAKWNSIAYTYETQEDLEAHFGNWYAPFDGEYDGMTRQSIYKGQKAFSGSASTDDWSMAPILFFKQKAEIIPRVSIRFEKTGGVFIDLGIQNFANIWEGNSEKMKIYFANSDDYVIPVSSSARPNVYRKGSPDVDKLDWKADFITFGKQPIKASGSLKKGDRNYQKYSFVKYKSIGYYGGFEGVNIECKVLN